MGWILLLMSTPKLNLVHWEIKKKLSDIKMVVDDKKNSERWRWAKPRKLGHKKGKHTKFSSFPVINLSLEGQRQGPGLTWSEWKEQRGKTSGKERSSKGQWVCVCLCLVTVDKWKMVLPTTPDTDTNILSVPNQLNHMFCGSDMLV